MLLADDRESLNSLPIMLPFHKTEIPFYLWIPSMVLLQLFLLEQVKDFEPQIGRIVDW